MNKIHKSLDTRTLQLFIVTMESNSMTEAADKLAINQSTISHALNKLRDIFNDPLLIRSGRSLTPTSRAIALLPKVKKLLEDFNDLTQNPVFNPRSSDFHYTIAANDFQREVLLPKLCRHLKPMVKSLQLTIVPSWLPDTLMLRDVNTDMVISPCAPDSADVMQRKLFTFNSVCYYDADQRQPPKSEKDFIDSNYVCPIFLLDLEPITLTDSTQKPIPLKERTQIITSGFCDTAGFLKNTQMLAIAPSLLAKTTFKQYAYVPFPYTQPVTMYLLWNKKHQKDPKHIWFREQLTKIAADF